MIAPELKQVGLATLRLCGYCRQMIFRTNGLTGSATVCLCGYWKVSRM